MTPRGWDAIGMPGDDEKFECPECGSLFDAGTKNCPGCGMEFEWDEEETEEALDELIEQVEEEAEARDPDADLPTTAMLEPEVEPPSAAPEPEYVPEPAPEPEPVPEPAYEEPEPEPSAPPKKKKALSTLGMVFALLAVVAVIGTVVLLNYDVWVQGLDEENIGPNQQNAIYLGVAGIVVCALIVVFDFMKNRKAA